MKHEHLLSFNTRRGCCVPLESSHESLFCTLYSDANLMKHVGPVMTPARARRAFAATLNIQARRRRFDWVVTDGGGDCFALVGFRFEPGNPSRAELGCVVKQSHHNRGLATELVAGATLFGFQALDLDSVICHSSQGNKAALVFMTRLGFSRLRLDELPHAGTPGFRWELAAGDGRKVSRLKEVLLGA